MENRKGNEIFLGVVGVATLLVAIVGATFAYFSASARSDNEAIKVISANLSLGYSDVPTYLSTNLIPTADDLALYAGTNADWIAKKTITYQTPKLDEDGEVIEGQFDTKTTTGKGLCKDDYSNDICGVYTFTVGNPNFTTAMNIEGKVVSTVNDFENAWFAIFDENNEQVGEITKFPTSGQEVAIDIDQQLIGSGKDLGPDGNPVGTFDAKKPETYTKLGADGEALPSGQKIASNVRTYTMIIWIHETGTDQTSVDSGQTLTAAIRIDTESGAGVTGVIAAAKK